MITWSLMMRALSVSIAALVLSFFLFMIVVTAYFIHLYPHDGQVALPGAFYAGCTAPIFACEVFLVTVLEDLKHQKGGSSICKTRTQELIASSIATIAFGASSYWFFQFADQQQNSAIVCAWVAATSLVIGYAIAAHKLKRNGSLPQQ